MVDNRPIEEEDDERRLRQLELEVSQLEEDYLAKLKAYEDYKAKHDGDSSYEVLKTLSKASVDHTRALDKYGYAQRRLIRTRRDISITMRAQEVASRRHTKEEKPAPTLGNATLDSASGQGAEISLFERSVELAELVGCDDHVLIYNFWVPQKYASIYKDIVEKHGHIAAVGVLDMNSLVSITRSLLGAATGMFDSDETNPSAKNLKDWDELLTGARQLGFNIGWLDDLYKEVKVKYNIRAQTIAKLKEELGQLEAVVKEKQADKQRLLTEISAADTSVNLAKAAFAAKEKELRQKEAEFSPSKSWLDFI